MYSVLPPEAMAATMDHVSVSGLTAAGVFIDMCGPCYHQSHVDVPDLGFHLRPFRCLRDVQSWPRPSVTVALMKVGCAPHLGSAGKLALVTCTRGPASTSSALALVRAGSVFLLPCGDEVVGEKA